jgi:predicted transcriptional regulator
MATPVSLRLDPKLKTRLQRAAKAEKRSLSFVAQEAIASYLDARDWRHEQIEAAYKASLQETEFVSGEAAMAWVNSWGSGKELPRPAPDVTRKK